MQNSVSSAFKGIAEYTSKVAEFATANIESHVEFVKRLSAVRSPVDVAEICQNHSSRQLKTLTEQAKVLTELIQEIAASASQPLKTQFDKTTRASRYQD